MTVPCFRWEYRWVEQKDQSKARILNTGFNGQGSDVVFRQLCQSTSKVSGSQSSSVMKCNDEEHVEDIVDEYLEILHESNCNHTYKEYDR